MDEMPSGALNGFTPNEARKITSKIIEMIKNTENLIEKDIKRALRYTLLLFFVLLIY